MYYNLAITKFQYFLYLLSGNGKRDPTPFPKIKKQHFHPWGGNNLSLLIEEPTNFGL